MKKFIGIFLLPLLLASCCNEKYVFEWTDTAVEYRHAVDTTQTDTLPFGDYHAALVFTTDVQEGFLTPPPEVPVAKALSCEYPYKPVSKIQDLKLITVVDYNANYPAGSDMAEVVTFEVLIYDDAPLNQPSAGEEFVEWFNSNETFYEAAPQILEVKLSEAPDGVVNAVFDIEIIMENGKTLSNRFESTRIK